IAGAGSGKTTILTYRVARLIKEQKTKSGNILCLTFTRNAGAEMKERIINLIGIDGKNIFCNTFHSFCVSVLKKFGYKLGYNEDFSIYGEKEKIELIKNIFIDLCIFYKKEDIKKKDIEKTLECIKYNYNSYEHPKISDYIYVANEYKYRLKGYSAVDLDILLNETLKLMKDKEVQDYYHNKYSYCFIDEYQDSSDIQVEIVDAIKPANLFVVGDIDQCIYKWRNANPEIMMNFPNKYPCEVIKLEDNFRSTYPIVAAANNLIKNNKNRFDKKSIAHKEGEPIEFITSENPSYEAYTISEIILDSIIPFENFAILSRTNSQLNIIKKQFKTLNIPFKVTSNDDIFDIPLVENIFNFISACLIKKDNNLIKKAINFPNKILSSEQIAKLELKCIESNKTLFEGLCTFKFKDQEKINIFLDIINMIEKRKQENIITIFKFTKDILNINKNLDKVLEKLQHWTIIQNKLNEPTNTETFLKWLKIKDIQTENEFLKEKNDTGAVNLMTVHGSKGLEFPIIFIIGMNEGVFPNKRSPIEDERNLFYVAITRAKDKVYLSSVDYLVYKNNFNRKVRRSRFLNEL
ncbi:ATP-dependent helicase, partial [Clostridium cochlearium]|uniref:ATP-dependent helicase n=1 Tax=Clostridium cochlearium TaxID=1494 RepID=UPI00185DC6B8